MKPTPGPWIWRINRATKRIHLVGRGLTVMDFWRYGMSSAAPRFRDSHDLMVRSDELACDIPGERHHRNWNQDIDHPDARLIAAAPEMLAAMRGALAALSQNKNFPADIEAAKQFLKTAIEKGAPE